MKKNLILLFFIIVFVDLKANTLDFWVTKFECSDSIVKPGDEIRIKVTELLTGDSIPSDPVLLQIYLSTDTIIDSNDIEFCRNNLSDPFDYACFGFDHAWEGSLIQQENYFTVPHPYDLAITDYYIIAKTDFKNKFAETDEKNNILYQTIKITGTSDDDFYITNASTNNVTLQPHQVFNFSFDNGYHGNSEIDIKPILNCMYSRDTIWDNSADDQLVYANPRTGSVFNKTDTIKRVYWKLPLKNGLQGEYYLLIKTDWNNRYKEVDETNNIAIIKIFVEEEVNDLWIYNVTSYEKEIQPGQRALIKCVAGYDGNNASNIEATIQYYLSKDTLIDQYDWSLCSYASCGNATLSSGYKTYTNMLELEMPTDIKEGNYYIIAKILTPSTLTETDTSNNTNYCSVAITGTAIHDFYPSDVNLSTNKLYAGSTLYTWVTLNYGGNSRSWIEGVINLYFSTDSLWDTHDVFLGTTYSIFEHYMFSTELRTRELWINASIPYNLRSGEYYLIFKADPDEKIIESNEANNTISTKISVESVVLDFIVNELKANQDTFYPGSFIQTSSKLRCSSTSPNAVVASTKLYLSTDTILHNEPIDSIPFETHDAEFYTGNQTGYNSFYLPEDITSGNYYLILTLDDENLIDETNERNNVVYTPVVVKEAPVHDFGIENISIKNDSLKPQESLSISFDQVYYGNSTEEITSQYAFYFSKDSIPDYSDSGNCTNGCASYGYSSTNPRQQCWAYFTIPASTQPGNYYFIFVADYGNHTKESNEANNTVIVPVVIEAIHRDYSIDSLSLTPASVPSGDYATVKIYCNYHGNEVANNGVPIQLRLSKNEIWNDSDDYLLCNYFYCPQAYLGYFKYETVETQIFIPEDYSKGDYYILAYIDADNQYAETNESNNITSKAFQVSGEATRDFFISNISLSDTIVHPKASTEISYTHHYRGNSSLYLSDQIGFYISKDTIWDSADLLIQNGDQTYDYPGGNLSNPDRIFNKSILIPQNAELGIQYLILKADVNNQHQETNEENNTAYTQITIVEETVDLSISQCVINHDTVQIGGAITANFTGVLTGNTLNDINFSSRLFTSNDSILSSDDVVIGYSFYSNLNKNQRTVSIPLDANIPTAIKTGKKYLLVKIDEANKYAETDETNNVVSFPIFVQPAPVHDFYIRDVQLSDTKLQSQSYFPIEFTYCYGGNSIDNVASYFHLYLSKDTILSTSSDTDLNLSTWINLSASHSTEVKSYNFSIPENVDPGDYYLLLVADSDNSVKETNEKNNVSYIKVEVEKRYFDFTVQSVSLSSDSLQKGGAINVSYLIRKNSNSKSEIYLKSAIYLSSDSLWGYDDIQLSNSYNYIPASKNDLTIDGQSIKIPDSYAIGNYFLLVKADDNNSFDETDETNNVKADPFKVVQPATRDFYITNPVITTKEIQPGSYFYIKFYQKYAGNSIDLLRSGVQLNLSKDTIWGNSDDIRIGTYDGLQNNIKTTSVFVNNSFATPTTVEPGKYNLLLKADYTEKHIETNETNNVVFVPIEIEKVISDFSISNLSFTYDTAQAGGFLVATYDMNYNGNSINSIYSYRDIVVSSDSIFGNNDDKKLSQASSGSSFNRSYAKRTYSDKLVFPIDIQPGAYYVIIKADSKDNVGEINEGNNFLIKPIVVLPSADNDFFLSELTLSFDTLQSQLPIPFNITCNYSGNSISDVSTSIKFFISNDSIFGNSDDNEALYYSSTITYANRNNRQVNMNGSFTIPNNIYIGHKYLFVKVDPANSIQETDESNNVLSFPVYIEEVVSDLSVSNIVVDPIQIQQEGSATISFTIDYLGNSKRTLYANPNLLLSKDSLWDENTDVLINYGYNLTLGVSNLNPIVNRTFSFTNTKALPVGDYYVLVKIDTKNAITEVNENNNIAIQKVQIIDKATRDFSIANLQVYKQQVYQGNSFNVSFDLNYEGNSVDLLSVTSQCVLSGNEIWGDNDDIELSGSYYKISKVNKDILTDRCLLKSISLPNSIEPGKYYLLVKADSNQEHAESSENNNVATIPFEVLDRELDYFVKNLSVDSDTIYSGSIVNLLGYYSLTCKSLSTMYATCDYYLSSDNHFGNSDDRFLVENNLTINSANPFVSMPVSIPSGIAPGTYYIYAQIRSYYSLADSNEGNNIARTKMIVSGKGVNDFYIDNVSTQKDSFPLGEPIEIGFDIHYNGNNRSKLPCHYEARLTIDGEWGNYVNNAQNNISITKDSSIVHVNATLLNTYSDTDLVTYIMVKADDPDQYSESNEENNVAVKRVILTDYPKLDLSVSNLEISHDSVCQNSTFRCNYGVEYSGDISYQFTARTYVILSTNNVLGDDDDRTISQKNISFDPKTKEDKQVVELSNVLVGSFIPSGEYTLFAFVQPFGDEDTNRTNNQLSLPFKIVDQSKGDFMITDLKTTSDSVPAANYLRFEYTMHSKNNLFSFYNLTIAAQLSSDTIWDNSANSYYLVFNSLLVDTDSTRIEKRSLLVPKTITPGQYYLVLKVDAANYYNEENENNNSIYCPIKISPPAVNDFHITDLKISPEKIIAQQEAVVSGKFHNDGNNPNFVSPTIKFYVSANDKPNDLDDISTYSLSNISLNIDSISGLFSVNANWFSNLAIGSYNLIVAIDSLQYQEKNTENNVSVTPFEILCQSSTVHEFIDLCGNETYEGWTEAGDYKRVLTSAAGCDSTVYTHLQTFDNPVKPLFYAVGDTLISSTSEGNQWYFEQNKITEANNNTYLISAKGNYAVQITDEYGCQSEISDYLYVNYSGISELKADLIAYPNPTRGLIHLSGLPNKPITFSVYDSNGKLVLNQCTFNPESSVDISDQPAGMYLIKINNTIIKIFKH